MTQQNTSFSLSERMSVRLSFKDALTDVMRCVEYDCIRKIDQPSALELCKIITEVMLLNPDHEMQIGNDMIPVGVVQEIYLSLTAENIELVIENFRQRTELIKNKKAYLRASLYNTAFEIDAHYTNLVRHDGY